MLQAIAISGHMLIITVDGTERRDLDLPDGVLTEAELAAVRDVSPGALPGYVVYAPPVYEGEGDQ